MRRFAARLGICLARDHMRFDRTLAVCRRRVRRVLSAVGRLRPSDVPLLLRMVWLVRRYQRLQASSSLPALAGSFDAQPHRRSSSVDVRRLTYLIDLIMKTVYRDRYCMKRSLLHFYFLRERNLPVTLHFGVRKSGDHVSGHAWVEIDGYPYAERYDPRGQFVETYRYPPVDDDLNAPTRTSSGTERGANSNLDLDGSRQSPASRSGNS